MSLTQSLLRCTARGRRAHIIYIVASLSLLILRLCNAARLKLRWRARTTRSIIFRAAIDYQAADDRLVWLRDFLRSLLTRIINSQCVAHWLGMATLDGLFNFASVIWNWILPRVIEILNMDRVNCSTLQGCSHFIVRWSVSMSCAQCW